MACCEMYGATKAAPCGKECPVKCVVCANDAGPCCGSCGGGSSVQRYTALGDKGEVTVLGRPKGSLSVREVKDGCCRN